MKSLREVIFSFLMKYSEYNYQNFQIVLFKDKKQLNLLNFITNNDDLTIIQVKQDKVFQKEISFNDLNNSVFNLLLNCDTLQTFDLKDYLNYTDLFNGKTMDENMYRYLNVLPIYNETSLAAAFFVYANYNYQWQFQDKTVLSFIGELRQAIDEKILNEIKEIALSDYFSLEKDNNYFLSKSLADLVKKEQFTNNFTTFKHQLFITQELTYQNMPLIVYKHIDKSPIYALQEITNYNYSDYSIVYLKNFHLDDLAFLDKVNSLIDRLDAKFGEYKIFDCHSQGFIIIFEQMIKKKDFLLFIDFNPIIVRKNDISFTYNLFDLAEYLLTLDPLEDDIFKPNDFRIYLDQKIKLNRDEVINKYQSTKIKEIKLFNSLTMSNEKVLLKDIHDAKYYLKDNKIKTLNALLKVRRDDLNTDTLVFISDDLLVNEQKPFIKALNIVKDLADFKTSFVVESEDSIVILQKYLKDCKVNLYVSLKMGLLQCLKYTSFEGLFIDLDEYEELCQKNEEEALRLIKYLRSIFKLVIICVKQNDIVKYHDNNILLAIKL